MGEGSAIKLNVREVTMTIVSEGLEGGYQWQSVSRDQPRETDTRELYSHV